jgi:23S rRNA (uridine2552-2'-O)-methyltransferase
MPKSSPAHRDLKVKLNKGRGRKTSSRRWLERQLNDPYVGEAKRLGYRSRSAFKLIEIDDQFNFLKPGAAVVDLGAAPGGWSQVAAERVEAAQGHGTVIAIDLHTVEPIPGVVSLKQDFYDEQAPARLIAALGNRQADAVISDMAAHATGHRQTDHLKIMALCEMALEFARDVLAPGGTFVCKVLRGGTEGKLLVDMKRDFGSVKHFKPDASRQDSAELFVIVQGYRPAQE